jgi:nucleoside-diphosphate-sugar epimerase
MSVRVLVTGATGFVGSHIVRALAARSVDIVAVVRGGKEDRVKALPGVVQVVSTHDLFKESAEWWSKCCSSVQIVAHAAWYLEPGKYLNSVKNVECQIGTLNLAEGAIIAGVRRVVGIGSCFEYDLTSGVASLATPLRPASLYGASKVAVFQSLSKWLPLKSVEFAWCRLFYLYGPGEDARRLVPYIRSRLESGEVAELGSGVQIRDYLDVRVASEKVADIILGSCTGPFNICSGVPITVRQLAEGIADTYGRRDLLRFGVRPALPAAGDPPCVIGLSN